MSKSDEHPWSSAANQMKKVEETVTQVHNSTQAPVVKAFKDLFAEEWPVHHLTRKAMEVGGHYANSDQDGQYWLTNDETLVIRASDDRLGEGKQFELHCEVEGHQSGFRITGAKVASMPPGADSETERLVATMSLRSVTSFLRPLTLEYDEGETVSDMLR